MDGRPQYPDRLDAVLLRELLHLLRTGFVQVFGRRQSQNFHTL